MNHETPISYTPNIIQERKWEMLVEMVENDKDGRTDTLAD